MSLRGEFCRVLDKYKGGDWTRDKAALALEKYFNAHQTAEIIAELERLMDVEYKWHLPNGEPAVPYQDIKDRLTKLKAKETQL